MRNVSVLNMSFFLSQYLSFSIWDNFWVKWITIKQYNIFIVFHCHDHELFMIMNQYQFSSIFSSMGCAIFQLFIWTIFHAVFDLNCFSWYLCGTFDILSFSWIINEEGVNIKNFILFLSYKVIFGIWNNFKAKRTNFK